MKISFLIIFSLMTKLKLNSERETIPASSSCESMRGCCSYHGGLGKKHPMCKDGIIAPKFTKILNFTGEDFEIIDGTIFHEDGTFVLDTNGNAVEIEVRKCRLYFKNRGAISPEENSSMIFKRVKEMNLERLLEFLGVDVGYPYYDADTGEVKRGATLSGITGAINKYWNTNYSYQDIAQLNNIDNPNNIKEGDILIPNKKIPDITYRLVDLMRKRSKDVQINDPFYFREKVRKYGKWDLKNTKEFSENIYKEGFVFYGQNIDFDAPGNIHYGYVGISALWSTEEFLLRRAGENQIKDGTSKPEWKKDFYGDHPRDQKWIKYGMKLRKGIGKNDEIIKRGHQGNFKFDYWKYLGI